SPSPQTSPCGRYSESVRLLRYFFKQMRAIEEGPAMPRQQKWNLRKASFICTVAAALGLPAAANARDLVIVSAGGFYQDAQRDVFFKPFIAKTGIPMKDVPWDNGIGVLRAKVEAGNPDWDIVEVDNDELSIGCEEGLFLKLDWSRIAPRDSFY